MQYLDDELCNQICGLLINIHMEDRSKELEKKEIEKSGIFKSAGKSGKDLITNLPSVPLSLDRAQSKNDKQFLGLSEGKKLKKDKSMEDLLSSYGNSIYEEDLAIDENYTLEQYTLQKITLEWLNWNAQFFDYSDEPYLFYLAEILSKDFTKDDTQLFYQTSRLKEAAKNTIPISSPLNLGEPLRGGKQSIQKGERSRNKGFDSGMTYGKQKFDVYSPFRSILNLANLISKDNDFSINKLLPESFTNVPLLTSHSGSSDQLPLPYPPVFTRSIRGEGVSGKGVRNGKELLQQFNQLQHKPGLAKLIGVLASKEFLNKNANSQKQLSLSNKVLGQRNLRREYGLDNTFLKKEGPEFLIKKAQSGYSSQKKQKKTKALNYLDFDSTNGNQSYAFADATNRNDYSRKQTKRALQEEESKKVFVIINSFGGSVGNGITVHDALQFIKAGSLTLGLGVAASAASLVLAGGTISERYVTEGCHVMMHQPEGGINGQASDIWIDSQEIMKIRLDVAEIYSLSAHRPRHKILRDLDRDFYLTATETIHYGLADEIATNEVMHEIIEMTSKVWDFHDSKQQRLLETRDSANSGLDTQTQN